MSILNPLLEKQECPDIMGIPVSRNVGNDCAVTYRSNVEREQGLTVRGTFR